MDVGQFVKCQQRRSLYFHYLRLRYIKLRNDDDIGYEIVFSVSDLKYKISCESYITYSYIISTNTPPSSKHKNIKI